MLCCLHPLPLLLGYLHRVWELPEEKGGSSLLVEQGQLLPEASMEATRFLSAASKLYRNNVEERPLKSLCQLAWVVLYRPLPPLLKPLTFGQAFRKVLPALTLWSLRALGLEVADSQVLGTWMTVSRSKGRCRTPCRAGSSSARP